MTVFKADADVARSFAYFWHGQGGAARAAPRVITFTCLSSVDIALSFFYPAILTQPYPPVDRT